MSLVSNKDSVDAPAEVAAGRTERIDIFLHSFAFVFGFGVVFTLLGSAAGLLGASLLSYQIILQKIGGVLLVLFGLATLGFFFKLSEWIQKRDQLSQTNFIWSVIIIIGVGILEFFFELSQYLHKHSLGIVQWLGGAMLALLSFTTLEYFLKRTKVIKQGRKTIFDYFFATVDRICYFFNALLYTERRVKQMHEINPSWGYASSFAVGVSFSAGWVPCIGPILASILLLASNSATAKQGAALLAFYSLGLGIPFLITGLAFGRMTKLLRKMNRYLGAVSIFSGLFMIIMGYILWTDQITALITQFGFLNEVVFAIEEWVTGSLSNMGIRASNVEAGSAIPLAIFAGIISFISPCVLPLVPAYIGYLGGTTLHKT